MPNKLANITNQDSPCLPSDPRSAPDSQFTSTPATGTPINKLSPWWLGDSENYCLLSN